VIPPEVPIVLLADEAAHATEAAVQLLRVGLDNVEGVLAGGFEGWSRAGLPTAAIDQLSAAELRDAVDRDEEMQLIDVRSPPEFASGHVNGAVNLPVGDLVRRAGELQRDAPTAVMCEGGYRSSLAASLLQQEGFSRLANVTGGMGAFREAVKR
jgi:hydroxyacylglutathione hydrolase